MKKNSSNKRLFLVAGYSAKNTVDAALVYLVQKLAACGDVILIMDSDTPRVELNRVRPYVLHADAVRHGEYDFGSYKRAYTYARDTGILQKYNYIYMVNDSVYGPLYPIEQYLNKMESYGTDVFGLVCNPHKSHSHIQSWFIGMQTDIATSKWLDEFMSGITHQPDKGSITYLYEQGFTRLLNAHDIIWKCMYSASGRSIYNNVKKLYRAGMPFIKKAAFTRHNGHLGGQIAYVLRHVPNDVRAAIMTSARGAFGDKYINWLLTRNPIKIMFRGIKYFIHKILNEGL